MRAEPPGRKRLAPVSAPLNHAGTPPGCRADEAIFKQARVLSIAASICEPVRRARRSGGASALQLLNRLAGAWPARRTTRRQ
jgi:hypothetical protein